MSMSTSSAGLSAFLFTDIEGSSLRWLNHRSAMEKAVARHDEIIRGVVSDHGGEIFKASGDAFYAAFTRPADAVNAAVAAQRALGNEDFSAVKGLKVRMAVHVGSAERRGNDYFGPALNRTARLLELAHGGQILVTASLPELLAAEREVGAKFDRVGTHPLDDPAQTVGVYQVVAPGLPEAFPPLRTAKTRLPDAPPAEGPAVLRARPRALSMFAALAGVGVVIVVAGAISYSRKPVPLNSSTVAAAPVVPEKSIAVLPFENLSKDEDNAFFANGIQDEILTDLARLADLKVISRSSVMQYKSGASRNLREIAPALGVIYILEGSVQRAGGKVRVTAQLIDSRTDAHVWAERYDRDLADVFAIQSEIAEKIAAQLNVRISSGEKTALAEAPTRDLEAYDLYLRARQMFERPLTSDEYPAADVEYIRLMNAAVARDPSFMTAWCALATHHDWAYFSGADATPDRRALAQAAVDAAVRLRPDSGEAHLARALHRYCGYRDFAGAREQLALARRTLPNNAEIFRLLGLIDRRQGRWDDSNRNLERALELDPRNRDIHIELGQESYHWQRRYADAERILRRLAALRPGAPGPQLLLRWIELDQTANLQPIKQLVDSLVHGPTAREVVVAESALELAYMRSDPEAAESAIKLLSPDAAKPIYWHGFWHPRSYFLGRIALMRNDAKGATLAFEAARGETEAVLAQEPDSERALMVLATIDSYLGRHEDAMREARRACEIRPIEGDALTGPGFLAELAEIESRAGERDAAFGHLALLAGIPSPITYGDLKLNPAWEPLRGEPRFEALVAKLAQQEPLK
jgi:TolB-like protein/class 3 adenylate cyclase/Tfp pilus assembly protein PilF